MEQGTVWYNDMNEESIRSNATALRSQLLQKYHHFFDRLVDEAAKAQEGDDRIMILQVPELPANAPKGYTSQKIEIRIIRGAKTALKDQVEENKLIHDMFTDWFVYQFEIRDRKGTLLVPHNRSRKQL